MKVMNESQGVVDNTYVIVMKGLPYEDNKIETAMSIL